VPARFAQDYTKPPPILRRGGLVSTGGDYARFCQMILNGGELTARASCRRRHEAAGQSPAARAGLNADGRGGTQFAPGWASGWLLGVTTGRRVRWRQGNAAWGGAAGTWFWVDPGERPVLHRHDPADAGRRRWGPHDLSRVLVYQALTDPAR
jgi:CubicO group peptidase (beta-lactamase class C family)